MDYNDSVQLKGKIYIGIISIICLFVDIIAFFFLYFNNSRKQNKSLIPNIIIVGCFFQSIISYCCLISTNINDFFNNNPLPKILSFDFILKGNENFNIFFGLNEYLIFFMKFFNFTIFIFSMIGSYMTEIFYCFESIYLFQNPVSNTKNRKIIYVLLGSIVTIIVACYSIGNAFNPEKINKNVNRLYIFEELDNDFDSILKNCFTFDLEFASNFSKCVKIIFGNDDRYFGIIIKCINFPLLTLATIYIFIDLISVVAILNSIKVQSKLFIYEKTIFRTRHIFYSLFGIIFTLAIVFSLYFIIINENSYINDQINKYNILCSFITIGFNIFGLSNSIFRILEIDILNRISFSGNLFKEGYNEKAIQQFLKLIEDNEEKEKLIQKLQGKKEENQRISKVFEDKPLDEKNINDYLSHKKNKEGIKNKLSLSAQIACDFISESVYYIVSCMTYIGKNIKEIPMIGDESYTMCNEHILKTDSSMRKKKNNYKDIINNDLIIEKRDNRLLSLIGDDMKVDNEEESNMINTNEINKQENEDIEPKENDSKENEWITRSISLKQVKLGNFFTNFFSRKIKIIEYAPEIFRNILRLDKIDKKQLISSFNVADNILKLSNFKGSEGKSGSIFFETHDKKFIIKTISEGELKSMMNKLIQKYYTLFSTNVFSNLTHIYGLYTLILGMSKVHVAVMENIFPFDKKSLICKYDLKGSSAGRRTKKIFDKKGVTLKDNDYIELSNKDSKYKINLTNESKDYINQVMSGDLNILEEAKLMDYSLFVCIAKKKNIEKEKDKIIIKDRIFESTNKKYVYILGIIDYLTEFGTKKKLEYSYKRFFNKKKYAMSSINPSKYRQRFILFLKKYSVL